MDRNYFMAELHPARYLIHKYWARKPHNILSEIINGYSARGDLVVDPFCGSGVFLAEAKAADRKFIGYDLNPTAVVLSKATTAPPESARFKLVASQIIQEVENQCGEQYVMSWNGARRTVRYFVHATVVQCTRCESLQSSLTAVREGRKFLCSACGERLFLNLEKLIQTEVIQVVFVDGETLQLETASERGRELLKSAAVSALNSLLTDSALFEKYDVEFLHNRRILAYEGMRVRDLFTPRAFRAVCLLAEEIHSCEDELLKNALLSFLTSSMAQFSRLIPYRNNLKSGGPAWTVPGFWVPPVHLETNPFVHLRARLERFTRGLKQLEQKLPSGKQSQGKVVLRSAEDGLGDLIEQGEKPALIFLDPPYGDNVPYLEFSTMWNAVIRENADFLAEIVVSDRKQKPKSWEEYRTGLHIVAERCRNLLAHGGHLAVTFNNLEVKAWYALYSAIERAEFECVRAWYQVPAVVSSKAQFSAETSYVGDVYSIFRVASDAIDNKESDDQEQLIIARVVESIRARDGVAPDVVVLRTAVLAILQGNLSAEKVLRLDSIIESVAEREGHSFRLRQGVGMGDFDHEDRLDTIVERCVDERLAHGECSWKELYGSIVERTEGIGIPTQSEVISIIKGRVELKGKNCYLRSLYSQPRLL